MPSFKRRASLRRSQSDIKSFGLSGKMAGMILLIGFFVLIPGILQGGFSNLIERQNEFKSYKNRLEQRIKKGLEPVIWNYDIDTLREVISAELINDNLKSVRISSLEEDIIWLTYSDGLIIDEVKNLEGKHIERHFIPIYRLDYGNRIFAYATIWYDTSAIRNDFFQRLRNDFVLLGAVLSITSLAFFLFTSNKLVKPLETIKRGMFEAGKSSFARARKKMRIKNFKWAFSEIKSLHRDLENMFDEIEMANFKLRESEAEFRAIFQQAGVGVAQVNAISSECIIANKKYSDILGFSIDELKNSSLISLTHTDDKEEQERLFNQLFKGEISEVSMEKRYTRKDGKIVWVDLTVSPLYRPGEPPTTQIAVIQDITDKKLAEERIRRLNDELEDKVAERTIDLENANCELEAALEDLRSVQTQLISNEKMAILGKLVAGIAHEINTPLGIINSAAGTLERLLLKEVNNVLLFNQKASQEVLEVYKDLVAYSIEGLPKQDFSQKRQMRKRYSAVDIQAVEISNEIVEKLVEMGYSRDTDEYIKLVEKPENHLAITNAYTTVTLYKSVKMISFSTEKASKVIMALRTYSHKDTNLEKIPYDVIKDMEMVLTLFYNQTKYGVEVIKDYGKVPQVMCIPDRLHQVWVNIINNALYAMDYKGVLKISISEVNSRVKVSITDSGNGISDAIIDRIFEPFFSTKRLGEGTGLGLDIVKRILDEIGGSIDFQTQPGETTFNVWLEAQKE